VAKLVTSKPHAASTRRGSLARRSNGKIILGWMEEKKLDHSARKEPRCCTHSFSYSFLLFSCGSDWLIDWLCWVTLSQNWGHQRDYCSSQVIREHGGPWWWLCRLGINPDSSTTALWQSYQQRHLEQVAGMEGVRVLPISIWGTSKHFLHAVKSYDMGPSGFTSHPRARCAADFYRP
jgi:hypothetical protein